MLSRREFLKATGFMCGLAAARPLAAESRPAKSVVAVVYDRAAVSADWKIDAMRTDRMVNEAVMLLTGQTSPEAAWGALFPGVKADDVVGIKVNTLNTLCPSHPEVALAVAAGLQKAGFKENNIIIWDRAEGSFIEGLAKSGYRLNRGASGVRCLGTNSPNIGYDTRNPVSIPAIGRVMPVSKIVSQVCRYLVNIPVLKNHGITGITGSLKSFYGAIPLGDRVSLRDITLVHQNNGDPQIAELYANPIIKDKTRLHIGDGLLGIYTGGPHGKPQWANGQILASTDPVAMDYQLLQIINAKRVESGAQPISVKANHLRSAEKLGLGVCTPALIEVRQKTILS